jgi:peptide/nickel transport system permease protein
VLLYIPVVTFVGFMFGIIIASSITTETVFVWPGLGRLVFEALMARDFPVIQGVVLIWVVYLYAADNSIGPRIG